MTITPNLLTRWAGIAAVAAGAIFIGVQINHPQLSATSIQTTDVYVRDSLKVLMCTLALVGITGMYLNQIRKHGLLGLIGYVVFAVGYLGILCVTFAAAYVLPEVANSNPGFVNDAIAVEHRPRHRARRHRGARDGDQGDRLRLPGRRPALRHRAVPGPRPAPLGRRAARRRRPRLRRPRGDAGRLLPVAGLPQRHRHDRPGLLAVEGRPSRRHHATDRGRRHCVPSTAGV